MQLTDKLIKTIAKTSGAYGIIEPNDKILVAVSGGKDSYGLLYLLHILKKRLPFPIDIVALHVAQGQPGVDPAPVIDWLSASGIPFEIAREDTYSVVQRNLKQGATPCAICSRLRRGIIYTRAEKLGCTKIALGHHREDTLATLMMNLFYSGKLQAMPPKYTTDDGRFEVIRPMIEVAEADLIALGDEQQFPIVPCALCSGQEDHKRRYVNEFLDAVQETHPALRNVMLGALKHVNPSHLMDLSIARTKKTQLD
ncbi:MAG: tRNA 2-thiocytidine(32) synthetase TtcA [Deltaproteobacteria bacterium]|nr:tRNA 2-thiocytidine(32) synthetase TtcA [Deltaproteobacteria bacterium]